jgi:branched-chain amino acid transport system substrate-binding protein
VDKINKGGGINGRPLNLIIYDDGSDPSKGVLAIKKLIEEDKVLGVTGPLSTGIAIPCATIAEEARVPMFAQNSSSWSVAEKPWDIPKPPTKIRRWVFKLGIDPIYQDLGIYQMMRDIRGISKIASINVSNAMGKAMRAALEATHKKAGFEAVIWEEFGPEDTDMTAQLTRIKGAKFDALVISGAEMASGITYKQARELGIKQPILGTPPIGMVKIVVTLGASLDGLKVPSYIMDIGEALPSDDIQRPVILELTSRLKAEKGVPRADTGHGTGWDGIYIFEHAFRRANPDLKDLTKARAQVRDAMETTKGFIGAYCVGDMTKWHELATPMIPVEIRGGKPIVVGKKIIPTWADLE